MNTVLWNAYPCACLPFRDSPLFVLNACALMDMDNASSIHNRCVVKAPMILLDCRAVNSTLVSRANELSKQILQFVASRSIDLNIAVCDKFKSLSAVLLKKPLNTRELVELVKNLNKFKKEERLELESDCAGIMEQLHFLFDLNFLVR